MPIHDWTKVPAGIFHDFHGSWIFVLKRELNSGVLPSGFYAMSEQVAGETGPDVLTLERTASPPGDAPVPTGATAVAEAPPRVSFISTLSEDEIYAVKRRTLVIRHVSGDRVVAYIEILSPGNKTSRGAMDRVLDKAVAVLNHGCHLLLIDLFPPGSFDPDGIHAAVWSQFSSANWRQPIDQPLTLVAYTGGLLPRAYVEPVNVGGQLPEMPLFLDEDWYVNLALETTYQEAYASVPKRWREVIEGIGADLS